MPQVKSIQKCALILLSTTKDWRSGDGNASTVADARTMLAALIYALDGEGFPASLSTNDAKQPALRESWKACIAAARLALDENGNPREPVGDHVVFWTADPNNTARLGDAAGLGLNWPFQPESHIIRVSGPILNGSDQQPKRLFFYDTIAEETAIEADADASPGFWPRTSTAGQDAAQPAAAAVKQSSDNGRQSLATLLFVTWVVTGVGLAIWLWLAARAMGNAVQAFKATAANCVQSWTTTCSESWSSGVEKQLTASGQKISDWVGNLLWTVSDQDPHMLLFVPFMLTMGSILLLMLAAGLARKGLWFGVLIDDRNRISLSRTQQVAWTVLLLGALAVMGECNAAALLTANSGTTSAWSLFPSVPGALWTALGINLIVTPYLSDAILKRKETGQGDGDKQPPGVNAQSTLVPTIRAVVSARLHTRENADEAAWSDLVTGETVGTDRELDVSRIQHLVISGTLLTTYFLVLVNQLGDDGGIVAAFAASKSIFAAMPPVDGGNTTFLGLLGVSHAGYLLFKAKQGEGTQGESGSAQPQAETT